MPALLIDALIDTLKDCLRLLPFLFLTYLFMEYLEHKTQKKTVSMLRHAGPLGPLIGSVLGAFPQCGFSAAAAGLYATGVISCGTLIAVFLSTSDEMLPIFLSALAEHSLSLSAILKIIGIKILLAFLFGCLIDAVLHLLLKKRDPAAHENIHAVCEKEHCHCENGILRSALHHTANILFFLFVIIFLLNAAVALIGEDRISSFVADTGVLSVFLTPLIGLIPNCAASVVITQLFLEGMIDFSAMMGGLLTGSGVGLLVLFRQSGSLKRNLCITCVMYLIGASVGIIMHALAFSPV